MILLLKQQYDLLLPFGVKFLTEWSLPFSLILSCHVQLHQVSVLSNTSSGSFLCPPFIFHQQLFQDRLFHILTYAFWWLACLFPQTPPYGAYFLKAFLRPCWIFVKLASHWQIYQVISPFPKYQSHIQRITELEGTSGQRCTWTSLDENLQDILLDVCPSIHLWKITVIDWEIGSKLNLTSLETDVQHITITQRETSCLCDSSSHLWCSKWRLRGREKCVQIKLDSRGHCSYDRKGKTTAGEQPSDSSGETTSRGLGTTMCCLEQQKQNKLGWTGRYWGGSPTWGDPSLPPAAAWSIPLFPAFLLTLNQQHFSLTNFLAAVRL